MPEQPRRRPAGREPEPSEAPGGRGAWDAKVRVDCPFCGDTIVGEFFEDVDAHIMACRERHPQKGRLTEEACRTRPEPELPYEPEGDQGRSP